MAQEQKNVQEQDLNQLRKVRREKLAELQGSGKDPFVITKYDQTHHSVEVKENYEELEGKQVSIAGRMMSKRVMGKASFCNVQDLKGNIQSYVARDSIGEENYKEFKKLDVGDVIGIEGEVFKTKTGEISIHASHVTLLSKSLQILPEKFHGLTNTDMRYRQRYVDLIMNPEAKDTFIKRSKIISAIRRYLDGEGFMEVETPMLVANAGGAAARPFETHFNALNEDLKLRISLELYLKRLIVGGLERVYEIGRVFRNEGLDTRHNPEFTLMELYQAYTDYNGMMDLTENLYRHVAQEVLGTTKIVYNGVEMDLGKPFERITMVDAVKKYAGVDWNEVKTLEVEKEMDEQAMELLKVFNLEDVAHVAASNLPYGQQRRLEIARAMATEPKLLLLDEPAAGMNPNETGELMDMIRFVREKFHMTILLIEHDMKLVSGICEKLTVLNFGEVLCEGKTSDVLNDPQVVTAYLGE